MLYMFPGFIQPGPDKIPNVQNTVCVQAVIWLSSWNLGHWLFSFHWMGAWREPGELVIWELALNGRELVFPGTLASLALCGAHPSIEGLDLGAMGPERVW